MNKVIIVTDSSAYLPQEIVEQYHLPILPLVLNWQGKQYRDGVDISAHEFYTQLSRSKEMASTSQVTVGQFEEIFKPLLDAGNDVFILAFPAAFQLHSTLPSKQSGAGQPET